MEETKEDINTMTHQITTVDDDMNRLKNVKEVDEGVNVAVMALVKSFFTNPPTLRVKQKC
jgi:hypothetical protein